jgi:phosphatidylglycerophosphate synthase
MPPSGSWITAANVVTAIRASLVALLAGFIVRSAASREEAWAAVVIATVAAVLDGVDGWLARRSGTTSAFGARFDMETDALLVLVLSVLAWQWGKAGAWVLLSGLMRYVFMGAGVVLPWMARPLTGTRRGQTVAVVQTVALIVAIGPIVPVMLSTLAAAGALGLLCWSFAIDVRRLRRGRESGA